MMVETLLECSQDFSMSNGSLPQWKRELLQRRAARSRPAGAGAGAPPPPPPPPPPPQPAPADDDNEEELRYGPGIVKRLKSRYLSLALRDAPRRRPSVLRRAASLEHLLDERPPRAPRAARPARPASLAAPAPAATAPPALRRDSVKRARSVDALSRLDACEARAPPSPSPPPPAPRPAGLRAGRPPRRPAPLLRDAERPPPDVVRSTLRKFESAPARRAAPAARVSAVLRGLEGPRRSPTPERQEPEPGRSPSPPDAPDAPPPDASSPPPLVSPPPPACPALPPPAPPSPPSSPPPSPPPTRAPSPPAASPTLVAPVAGAEERPAERPVSRAALEGIARAGSSVRYAFEAARGGSHLPPLAATNPVLVARRVGVIRPMPASPRPTSPPPAPPPDKPLELVNGHSTPEPRALSRIGAAGIERAWSGSPARRPPAPPAPEPAPPAPWLRAAPRGRAPPPAATSVVFNFSDRKEVPDYIENDGIILRAGRRNRIKAGEPGVVVLRPEALARDSDSEPEDAADGPPSPCRVRFVNDNVLMNGRSSMPARPRDCSRLAKLKLQFDDSLTRTFEYPSETSLCEEAAQTAPAPALAPAPVPAPAADAPPTHLADNTHLVSASLSRYTPSKTPAAAFQLGVTRHAPPAPAPPAPPAPEEDYSERATESGGAGAGPGAEHPAHAVPCGADVVRSWSEARSTPTDLLF